MPSSAWLVQQQSRLVFNVRDYGAVGDQNNDDTAAIQAAINAASVAGGIVFLPAGNYRITGKLIVNADNVEMHGVGWSSMIWAAFAYSDTLMLWYEGPNGGGYREGVVIRDLQFNGNSAASLTAMVRLDSMRAGLVENCEFTQHPTIGLQFESVNGTFGAYNVVHACWFHDSYTGTAIKTHNSEWCTFEACRFLLYNLSGAMGIDTENLNLNIVGCQFDAMWIAIHMFFSQYCNITGNQFDEGNQYFIQLSNCQACTVVGNTFNQHSAGTDVIHVDGGSNHTNIIANNVQQTGPAWTNFIFENNDVGSPPNLYIGNDCGSATIVLVTGIARCNRGYNPRGKLTTPGIPATTVAYTNNFGVDATVFLTGGTVSAVAIGGQATGLTSGAFRVPAGQTITLTYTVAPTWTWFGD